MYRYPLNGRPAAFWRGDWYVGKGVACARIRIGDGEGGVSGGGGGNGGRGGKDAVVEVFCTHLHAPYEAEPNDSYLCHRTAQAWEIARLMRHAAERGHMVLGLGDFNMVPLSLAHRLIEAHSPVRDIWRILKPDSALGAAESEAERARGRSVPTAETCLREHGATCDSVLNTWRWSKGMQKDLSKGRDLVVPLETKDPKARRLDYVFFAARPELGWRVQDVDVGMTGRHPELRCSLSDHFSVETTLVCEQDVSAVGTEEQAMIAPLPVETYDKILEMIVIYSVRERKQRRLRLAHFVTEVVVAVGCLVAVWWSPRNFVAFILMLVSTLGLSAGVIDGLMGGLFVGSEIRALKEFEYEIKLAREHAGLSRRKTQHG